MIVLARPEGLILRFDSLADMKSHVDNLSGMLEWATEEIEQGNSVKLAYMIIAHQSYEENRKIIQDLSGMLPDVEQEKS